MGQINTNNYPTVSSLADADLLIVENAVHGTGTTTPKQLRENAIGTTPLQTTAQTVTGAINELKDEMHTLAGIGQKTVYNSLTYTIDSDILLHREIKSMDRVLLFIDEKITGPQNLTVYGESYSDEYTIAVSSGGSVWDPPAYLNGLCIFEYHEFGEIFALIAMYEAVRSNNGAVSVGSLQASGNISAGGNLTADGNVIDGQGNTLSVLAEALTKTASGNPIVITDCAGGKARSLKTTINAIQDLHGYDHPWAGGAGKNKYDLHSLIKTSPQAGIAFSESNGVMSITGGTTSAEFNPMQSYRTVNLAPPLEPSTAYIFSIGENKKQADIRLQVFYKETSTSSWTQLISETNVDSINFTTPATFWDLWIRISVSSTLAIATTTLYPMVRLANVLDDTWEPYSNICPISGRTEARVDDVGKNQLPKYTSSSYTNEGITFTQDENGVVDVDGRATATVLWRQLFNFKGGRYILSGGVSTNNFVGIQTTGSIYVAQSGASESAAFDLPAGQYYKAIRIGNGETVNHAKFYPMLRDASISDSAYEPYTPTSAVIQLGQTVYGADINWDTGVMTVKTQRIVYDGRENWTASNGSVTACMRVETPVISDAEKNSANNHLMGLISNMFKEKTPDQTYVGGESNIGFSMGMDGKIAVCQTGLKNMVVDDWKTWLATNNLQIEYTLATPTTLQLTPTQLQMLKGYNRVTMDNGTIELGYIAKLT